MRVYLRKDVPNVGLAGDVIKVSEGYARNYLFPLKLAVEVTKESQAFYDKKTTGVVRKKEVLASKTSMLAEKIKSLKLTIKHKIHDDGKLYGAINSSEIVDLLAEQGVSISKSQVEFEHPIKEQGMYEITIKLSNKLKPTLKLKVASEK